MALIIVQNTNDAGADSLRDALAQAEANGAGDDDLTSSYSSYMSGGVGNDTITSVHFYNSIIVGGDGIDTLDISGSVASGPSLIDLETGFSSGNSKVNEV